MNINLLREKLNAAQGKFPSSDILWKPKEGENRIRIVPLAANPDYPFIELKFTYLGNRTQISPLSYDERCPMQEFADSVRGGKQLSPEEYETIKPFIAQSRWFLPIIDRADPDGGVKYWAFAKTMFKSLGAAMSDEDVGDITDPKTGRDLKVTYTPKTGPNTFPKTEATVALKESVLSKDSAQVKEWLTNQPDLMECYPKKSYDELKAMLTKFVNGGVAEAPAPAKSVTATDDDGWAEPSTDSPTANKARTAAKSPPEVDDEFAAMFKTP